MRITNTTIARNYTSSLNKNLQRLNYANFQVQTGRRFVSMSEDASRGVRSMAVRRNLAQLESYTDNAKSALNKFDGAEKALGQISEMAKQVYARYNYGINGTNSSDEREIIASEFEQLRDEILISANGQYADRYLFGGTNTMSQPFTLNDADPRELMYNGVRVKDIDRNDSQYDYLFNDAAYCDIGLGMTTNGDDPQILTNSAFKHTINGLSFMGNGDDNIYDMVNDIIASLREQPFDPEAAGVLLNKIKDTDVTINLERTRLGSDSQYLEFTISRLANENDNLIARQDMLEFVDPAEAIMDFKMQEYVYNAAMQMGSRLLQPTIFDFMR